MKLYATVTSERASKGQGGNKFLEIELKVRDRNVPIGLILLDYKNDIRDHKADSDEWVLTWTPEGATDRQIIAQGHVKGIKGKKQKTA